MAKEIGKIERKSRKSGAGSFFFGGFVGYLLCLATLAGVFCFVYFKVSPNFINKTFKTDINLGSEEANKKTVKEFISGAVGLVQNVDTYTLSNLNEDFGINIKDEMFGINIKDLKNVALPDLIDAIENKFGAISAQELRNVNGMNLEEEMGDILNKEVTYYYNDGKLYSKFDGTTYSDAVSFKYSVNTTDNTITVKEHTKSIVDGKVSIQLWYLPLTVAIGDFTSSLGDNLTLYDLTENYGVKLPTFFNFTEQELKDTTVNELQSAINDLHVADFLGYTIDKSNPDKVVVKNGGVIIEGFEAAVSQFTIGGLATGMKELKVKDIFTPTELESGIMSLINKETLLTNMADEISNVVTTKTIDDFVKAEVVSNPKGYNDTTKLNWVLVKQDAHGNKTYKQVKDLLLQDMVDVLFEYMDITALPSVQPTT